MESTRQRRVRPKRRRIGLFFHLLIRIVTLLLACIGLRTVLLGFLPPASGSGGPPYSAAQDPSETAGAVLTDQEKLAAIQSDPAYPTEMAEFAQNYPQVIDYVYDYPQKKDLTWEVDLSDLCQGGQVPLLLQWDERWGYERYSSGLIGYTGCGPVSLSMVALALTGDPQWTPIRVAKFATDNGYCVPGNGTAWTLISRGCEALGLHAQELPLMESRMKSELDKDHPIILVVGPGDFTFSGHYLVVTGYDDTGFTVNDPNSYENSQKIWPYDILKGQIRNLWAMSAA